MFKCNKQDSTPKEKRAEENESKKKPKSQLKKTEDVKQGLKLNIAKRVRKF